MRCCGIDEAGRGAVLGPLVVAAVVVAASAAAELAALGVRDSKVVARSKRGRLCAAIKGCAGVAWATTHVSSQEIDLRRRRGESLNDIEASAMLVLAKHLWRQAPFETLQIDSLEVDAERFAGPFRAALPQCAVVAQCGADAAFVAVSAASVVAKVERDAAVAELGEAVGSGYPADTVTQRFLRDYCREHGGQMPPFIRQTWNLTTRQQ